MLKTDSNWQSIKTIHKCKSWQKKKIDCDHMVKSLKLEKI